MAGTLTPTQRHDLVTKVHEQLKNLGLKLIPVTSHQAWKADCDGIYQAYNELAVTVRVIAREVDWP